MYIATLPFGDVEAGGIQLREGFNGFLLSVKCNHQKKCTKTVILVHVCREARTKLNLCSHSEVLKMMWWVICGSDVCLCLTMTMPLASSPGC